MRGATPGQVAAAALIAAFLAVFLVLPVGTVMYVAFTEKGTGAFTLVNFADFFRTWGYSPLGTGAGDCGI